MNSSARPHDDLPPDDESDLVPLDSRPHAPVLDNGHILRIGLIVEGACLLLAVAWGALARIPWWHDLRLLPVAWLGPPLGLVLLALNTNLLKLTRPFGPSGAHLVVDELLVPLVRPMTPATIVVISLASGLCEEALFRGVLQVQAGLVLATVIFGLLHIPGRRYLMGGAQAGFSGLCLGLLYAYTGSLMAAALAHATNNLAGMIYLKWYYRPPRPPGLEAEEED